MSEDRLVFQKGVADLLSKTHEPMPEGVYTFEGDLCQMAAAADAARELGFMVGVGGGVPYVRFASEREEVIAHLRLHRINGYWNYD